MYEPAYAERQAARVRATETRHFHRTDYGNAERLALRFGDNIRYCQKFNRWYGWDGSRWLYDETGAIMRLAKATARSIYDEVRRKPNYVIRDIY